MKQNLFILFLLSWLSNAKAQNYIFYLHGRIVENKGPQAVDEVNGYGAYLYLDILDSLKQKNNIVLSEVRQKNTDVKEYASKIKTQIDSLLKTGIQAGKITVIGASKGASIAMYVSNLMKNKDINFVFMAACYSDTQDQLPACFGNVLSLFEESDLAGSCENLKENSKGIFHYKEIRLKTNLKHGFLYKPLPEWIQPCLRWASGNYE